jgi:Protein of unknown function (DUF2961)
MVKKLIWLALLLLPLPALPQAIGGSINSPSGSTLGAGSVLNPSQPIVTTAFVAPATMSNYNLTSLTGGQADPFSGTAGAKMVPNTSSGNHGVQATSLSYTGLYLQTAIWFPASGSANTYGVDLGLNAGTGAGDNFFYWNSGNCGLGSTGGGAQSFTYPINWNGVAACFVGIINNVVGLSTAYWQVASSGSSPTTPFAGDGSSGIVIVYPGNSEMTQTSITNYFAVDCVNSSANQTGMSNWLPTGPVQTLSSSYMNVVAVPTSTGASYCQVYRSGGSTQGALEVSGSSTHVTPGTAVQDNALTADGTSPPLTNHTATGILNVSNPLISGESIYPGYIQQADTRTQGLCTIKTVTLAASGTQTLCSVPTGTPGTMDYFHFTIQVASDYVNAILNSTLNLTLDGGTTQTSTLGVFCGLIDFPKAYRGNDTLNIGNDEVASTYHVNCNHWIQWNFQKSATLTITNGSSSAASTIYADTHYRVGYARNPPQRTHYHLYETASSTVTAGSTINLLDAAITGGGEIDFFTIYISSGASYTYMENPVQIFCDGAPCEGANGFEDQFGSSFYFGEGDSTPVALNLYSDKWGASVGSALQTGSADDVMAYKFFSSSPGDNLLFNNAANAFWTNSTGASVTVRAVFGVWGAN